MLKKEIETCKALELLEKSEVIEIDDFLLQSWHLDTLDCEDDESVLECSYTDEEGYIFEYSFSKKALLDATVENNSITMTDDTDEIVVINCYSLNPVN